MTTQSPIRAPREACADEPHTAGPGVPFLDLRAQFLTIEDEIREALDGVLESGAYSGGPFVERFEGAFAAYCGCEHAVGVGSGTDALWAALQAVGVRSGCEVVTTPSTFVATAEAITFCGARPVFVDVHPQTYNIDPEKLEAALTPRTAAIVPVHLYGQMADMDPILEIGRRRGVPVVEDASQAHGAVYRGRHAGSIGDVGCFSFYPGKNLGAYGEAGAVVTNNPGVARTVRMFRDHGQERKYHHALVGFNARMDGFQGAVLSAKLRHLPAWTAARRDHAAAYTATLAGTERITTPFEAPYGSAVYHIYAVLVPNRDEVAADLASVGVQCGIHYPVPLHLQCAYQSLGYQRGQFPIAERLARDTLSLPMYAELTDAQRGRVVLELKRAVSRALRGIVRSV
jgi:dTDP-4-amino-4,6-dideoxygalactose transaminase